MAIISFWNESEKENGQTLAILALANQMAIEHNYRILIVDGTFHDTTIEKAFWKKKENKTLQQLNAGKIDVSAGTEGLISAVASNKATPEIITNYTRIVFKNRLDVLLGLKTEIVEDHEKSMMLYKDLVTAANKYYDMVMIDLSKGLKRGSTKALLEKSNVIVYTMPPNLTNIDNYRMLREKKDSIISKNKVMPLLSKSDEDSSYNVRNTSRYIKERNVIASVPYDVRFMEATNESKTAEFFTKQLAGSTKLPFFEEVERSCNLIIEKIKELNV